MFFEPFMTNKMERKRKFGQFFSTNADKILYGIAKPPETQSIIEPFCGNGDLVEWLGRDTVEEYDIEPIRSTTILRDTLRNPPSYSGKYILTNPPYLARNKSSDKTLYESFGQNDLFKIFIKQLCNDPPNGGIIIIPVNFWSSSRKNDVALRRNFLKRFKVQCVNIFEESVFDDTSCSVCSFAFERGDTDKILFHFYPDDEERVFIFDKDNNFTIAWNIISLTSRSYSHKVTRVVKGDEPPNTNITFRALDNISLEWTDEVYYGKKTSRTFASINIVPGISPERQKILINEFNDYVSVNRAKYKSLWLSNYREGARKRMGFDLAYSIISYLLERQIV